MNRKVSVLLMAAMLMASMAFAAAEPAANVSRGQEGGGRTQAAPADPSESPEARIGALDALLESIIAQDRYKKALEERLLQAVSEVESQALKAELDNEAAKLQGMREDFLKLLTGISLDVYRQAPKEEVKFFDELQSLFRPLLLSLREVSSRSREVQLLQERIAENRELEGRLGAGIQRAKALKDGAESKGLKKAIEETTQRLEQRLEQVRNETLIASEKLKDIREAGGGVLHTLQQFFTNVLSYHLRNLLLTVLSMAGAYFVLRILYGRLASTRRAVRFMERIPWLRIVNVAMRGLIAVFSLGVGLAVLYFSNDWILIGLFILVMLGLMWSMKDNIPTHLKQLQMLLDLGPVREGERVIHRGLPWKVGPINYYTNLVNPALEGGRSRMPLGELSGMVSRPFSRNEPWFPTAKFDWVILGDGTYGQVMLQTPDQVMLKVRSSSEKTYNTPAFLELTPLNLSRGFGLYLLFGLDYEIQAEVTETVPGTLRQAIEDGFAAAGLGDVLQSVLVEFDHAGASSLDVAIIALFPGEAAPSYYKMRRLLNRLAVDACTRHGWTIPFTQLTVHQAKD